jgi:hypothetical protein
MSLDTYRPRNKQTSADANTIEQAFRRKMQVVEGVENDDDVTSSPPALITSIISMSNQSCMIPHTMLVCRLRTASHRRSEARCDPRRSKRGPTNEAGPQAR